MSLTASHSFMERFKDNEEMMQLADVCQYYLMGSSMSDSTRELIYEAMYNFKTEIADKYDLDMNKVCKKLELIGSVQFDENVSDTFSIEVSGGKAHIHIDELSYSYDEVARSVYTVLGSHLDKNRYSMDVSTFFLNREDENLPGSAYPKGYLYLETHSPISEKVLIDAIVNDTITNSEIGGRESHIDIRHMEFETGNPGSTIKVSYTADDAYGLTSLLMDDKTFLKDKFEALNKEEFLRSSNYMSTMDKIDALLFKTDVKDVVDFESSMIDDALKRYKNIHTDSSFRLSDYIRDLASVREHSATVTFESDGYSSSVKLSDIIAQERIIKDLYGQMGHNTRFQMNVNNREDKCSDYIAAIQAIQEHGIGDENHFSNISYTRASNGVLKVYFGEQEIYVKSRELSNGQIEILETKEPTLKDKIIQKIEELSHKESDFERVKINTREALDVMSLIGNASKIEHGVQDLWDLAKSPEEISHYGEVLQGIIIREAIENTDFSQKDSNGANILHILAAGETSLDEMMIDCLKASDVAIFVKLLNEKDNDGKTPVEDMVDKHGFVIEHDDEFGFAKDKDGNMLDNEFGHASDISAGSEFGSAADADSEFGDIGDDFDVGP